MDRKCENNVGFRVRLDLLWRGGPENHYVESFKPEDNDETRLDSRRIYAFG